MTLAMTSFFLVPRPGTYGDRTTVVSSHATLAAAQRAIRGHTDHLCVRAGPFRKGERWHRVDEPLFPLVVDEVTG